KARRSLLMVVSRDHGSGTIIITAWGNSRPASVNSSRTLSNIAESEPSVSITVRIFFRSLPKSLDRIIDCRACIQLMLPRSVLISPLCEMYRYGCARPQEGNVLVENRECTIEMADETAESCRSR